MLSRHPKIRQLTREQEQRHIRRLRSQKDYREGLRRGLALYRVTIDGAVLDLVAQAHTVQTSAAWNALRAC
jgi:hypothetical protein